jgi:hypothetical protein
VVVAPALVYAALAAPLHVSVLTTPFDTRFIDVPDASGAILERDRTYVLTGDPGGGDEVDLVSPRGSWPFGAGEVPDGLQRELGTFVARADGRHRVRVEGPADSNGVVILSRDPFATSSPEARLNFAGSIGALVLFVALAVRWNRARARVLPS